MSEPPIEVPSKVSNSRSDDGPVVTSLTKSHSIVGGHQEPSTDGEEFEEVIIPPDGGWGWIIVIASFCTSILVDGIIYSFGVFLDPIYNANNQMVLKSSITWVGSLSIGFSVLGGPVVSILANKLGFRAVAVIGSIISAGGILIAWIVCFAAGKPVMGVLYVFYGVVSGFGLSMLYVPSVVVVGFYFDKRRAFATGIAVCGSGVGSFVFPPILDAIISNSNWDKALIFYVIVLLICGLLGLTYRPVRPTLVLKGIFHQTVTRQSFASMAGITTFMKTNTSRGSATDSVMIKHEDIEDFEPAITAKSTHSSIELGKSLGEGELPHGDDAKQPIIDDHIDQVKEKKPQRSSIQSAGSKGSRFSKIGNSKTSGITMDLDSVSQESNFKPIILVPIPKGSSCFINCCQLIFDFSLVTSPTFILLCVSSLLSYLGVFVPFLFLKEAAQQNIGLGHIEATFLISIIGIGNLTGRLVVGLITDYPCINALLLNNVSQSLMGLSTLAIPFLSSYWQFVLYSCVFGVSMGSVASLRAIILIELLGLNKLTNAFGIVCMMYGLGIILGLPFAGLLSDINKDARQQYTIPFLTAGAFMLVGGFLCYPLNHVKRWETARSEAKATKEVTPS